MDNRKRTDLSVGMGGGLIITLLIVICLMIFAVLSFTTAYSDLKLSKRAEEMVVDYYDIHGRAEEKLSEISETLFEVNKIGSGSNIISALSDIEDLSLIRGESPLVKYDILGEKNQKISVELEILNDTKSYYYEITNWNLSNIHIATYEEEIIDMWEGTE